MGEEMREAHFVDTMPNIALNRTGRYSASFLLASARPAV